MAQPRLEFRKLYELLDRNIEPGVWWPADTDFEIGVGAILTHNTAWTNVELALAQLREHGLLTPEQLAAADLEDLQRRIRPAGFMTSKSQYLQSWAHWFRESYIAARNLDTDQLRHQLLHVQGIGPETADVVSLYIYDRPVFIWDTYARRVLTVAGYPVASGYEPTRRRLTDAMQAANFTVAEQQRFHGLIVEAGKAATSAGGWEQFWARLS